MGTRKPDPEKTCAYCGKRMQRNRYGETLEDMTRFLRRRFCGRVCMARAQEKQKLTLNGMRSRAKRLGLKGTFCEKCGATEDLHLHHENENPFDNRPENLRTLCATCHQKLHRARERLVPKQPLACKVCGLPSRRLGMCPKHYQRYRLYGDPCLTKRRTKSGYELVREEESPPASGGASNPLSA